MAKPITFGVIGGAWRAEFFFRIAQALPDQFRIAGCVTKTEATRARIKAEWKIPVFDTLDALLDEQPRFVVTSVPRAASGPLLVELAWKNMPVLAETPPAADLAALNQMWRDLPAGARIQVAEQYPLAPLHAARLAFARSQGHRKISRRSLPSAGRPVSGRGILFDADRALSGLPRHRG